MTSRRRLTTDQTRTWLALWTVSEWLPSRLDEQLKRDNAISLHDYFVLAQVSHAAEPGMTMSALARAAAITPSRLSYIVNRLEERGWVTRHHSTHDRRAIFTQITDTGRSFLRQAAPGHVQHVLELLFDNLTADEADCLGSILRKVVARVDPSRSASS